MPRIDQERLEYIEHHINLMKQKIVQSIEERSISHGRPPSYYHHPSTLTHALDTLQHKRPPILTESFWVKHYRDYNRLYRALTTLPNLPFFQWTGNITDPTRPVFPDPKSCIDKFESVLLTQQVNLDLIWAQHLSKQLPDEIRAWFQHWRHVTWQDFKLAFLKRYDGDQKKKRALEALQKMRFGPDDTVLGYLRRFRELRSISGCQDELFLKECLMRPLECGLSAKVTDLIEHEQETYNDVDSICQAIMMVSEMLEFEKLKDGYQEPVAPKFCSLHHIYGHSLKECFLLRSPSLPVQKRSSLSIYNIREARKCHRCYQTYGPNHVCKKTSLHMDNVCLTGKVQLKKQSNAPQYGKIISVINSHLKPPTEKALLFKE